MNQMTDNQIENTEGQGSRHDAVSGGRRSRPSRRGRRIVATFLTAATLAAGALAAGPGTASAGITNYYVTCGAGTVSPSVGVAADLKTQYGGQWASVRFIMTNPYGGRFDTGWRQPFFAPNWNTQFSKYEVFKPGWWDWTAVYAFVAYWDGQRWYTKDLIRVDDRERCIV